MKQQGAGLEPSTFLPEVQHAVDCAAKACLCGRVNFRAYKPRDTDMYRYHAVFISQTASDNVGSALLICCGGEQG